MWFYRLRTKLKESEIQVKIQKAEKCKRSENALEIGAFFNFLEWQK